MFAAFTFAGLCDMLEQHEEKVDESLARSLHHTLLEHAEEKQSLSDPS